MNIIHEHWVQSIALKNVFKIFIHNIVLPVNFISLLVYEI